MAGDRGWVAVLPTPAPCNPGDVKDALLVRPEAALAGERNAGVAGLMTCGAAKLVPVATRYDCAVIWLAALPTPFGESPAGKLCHALPVLVGEGAAVKFGNDLPGEFNTASRVEDDAAVKICGR